MSDATSGRDRTLGKAACAFLGAILLFASYAKLLEPGGFVAQIHLEGLDFWWPATRVAVIAVFVETVLGLFLLLGVTNRIVLGLTLLLVLFFLYLTGHNYWLVLQGLRDPEAACGCFGDLIQRSAAQAFWQDLLMLGLPLVVAFRLLRPSFHFPPLRSLAVFSVSILVTLFLARDPSLVAAGDALHFAAAGARDTGLEPMPARLFVDDEEDAEGRVYLAEGDARFVLAPSRLPYVIILDPRQQDFRAVAAGIQETPGGQPRLVESADALAEGKFTLDPEGIRLAVNGTAILLIPGS